MGTTIRTPPNYYTYTPYLIKLEYYVRLTCLCLYYEN